MISTDIIKQILSTSINAPSGSNSQPWRFEIDDNKLRIFAKPEEDHPILNYRNRGTLIAHGALIENIKISATALGYHSDIKIFPESTNAKLIAEIRFRIAAPKDEGLYQVLSLRTTNRKRFGLNQLSSEQQNYLDQSVSEVGSGGVDLTFIESRDEISRLGQVAAANEIVTLENEKLHRLFFDEIIWNKQDEKVKKKGLYIDTMELRPPERLALKLFKNWSVMSKLVKLGVVRKIAASNAKNYAETPLIILVTVKDDDQAFISAGRVIERIWLKAARLGFGFHLITGTMFFWQGINLGGLKLFSDEHQRIINEEYQKAVEICGVESKDKLITAMLRIGLADEPSAYSSKKQPEIKYL